jgi:hypothetical protein
VLRRSEKVVQLTKRLGTPPAHGERLSADGWRELVELALLSRLAPALHLALAHQCGCAPEAILHLLAQAHALNSERNVQLRTQVTAVMATLATAGIACVALKGAGWLFDDKVDLGARILTDLDLLIPPTELQRALAVLSAVGYHSRPADTARHANYRHHPPLQCPGELATLELHTQVLSSPEVALLPGELMLHHREPTTVAAVYRPCPTHAALHAIAHAQLADEAFARGQLPLRALHDTLVFTMRPEHQIDWRWIAQRMARHGYAAVLDGHLDCCQRLLGMPRPAGVPRTWLGALHLPRCLRQLDSPHWERWGRWLGEAFATRRMTALYGVALRPTALAAARIRHLGRACRRGLARWLA